MRFGPDPLITIPACGFSTPRREVLQKFALDHRPRKSESTCIQGGNHRSDYIGARALLSSLPNVKWLLGDRGYDADWFREALQNKGIRACIPGRKQRKTPVKYDTRRYKRRNRIEIMFGRLKDWRRVATRYDQCPKVFLSAIALAAVVLFWL